MIEPSCLEMIESLPAETRDPKVVARGMRYIPSGRGILTGKSVDGS